MKFSLKWRLTAVAALLALISIGILMVKAILTQPVLLAVVIFLIGLIAYAGWLIFTGTGKRLHSGRLLLFVSLLALVVIIIGFFQRGNDLRQLVSIIGLGVIYSLLLTELRNQYWTQKRAVAQQQHTANFNSPILIINPKSGNGRAIKAGIDKKAAAAGIKVIITKRGDSIEGLARAEVARGADVLGVSGGDGTLGAVAKIALEHNLPLVALPGGTRCHFARDAGFEPERITDALESFTGVETAVDVGDINGRIFLNNASFGLYADIVDNPEYREHKVATSRKVLQDILEDNGKAYSLQFRDHENNKHQQAVLILVGVGPYETLNLLELGHRKSLSSGKLQISVVTRLDDATVKHLLGGLPFKKNASTKMADNFLQWEVSKFSLSSKSAKLVVGVDGEREEYSSPVKISLLPGKLRLMMPAEGMRGRKKLPLDTMTIKRLWRAVIGREI